MGMTGILCTLSPKRLQQLLDEPDLVEEVVLAIGEVDVPGSLQLHKAWDALDFLLCARRDDAPLSAAIVGRGGEALGEPLSYGPARVLSIEKVTGIAEALAALGDDHIAKNYAALSQAEAHAGYGNKLPDPDLPPELDEQQVEISELSALLTSVRELYKQAADSGHAMLVVII